MSRRRSNSKIIFIDSSGGRRSRRSSRSSSTNNLISISNRIRGDRRSRITTMLTAIAINVPIAIVVVVVD